MARRIITIMADFGFAPYAWGKDFDEEQGVGGNIADEVYGLSENYDVPAALDKKFADWCGYFERHSDEPDFDWPAFHAEGMALTDELRTILGRDFEVRYVKPMEDPEESRRMHELFLRQSLETRIKAVYPSGTLWERSDDQLDQNEYVDRVRAALDSIRQGLPLQVHAERWSDPLDNFAFTHFDAPDFDTWVSSMDNAAKIRWIKKQQSPYVVLFLRVSRVADYYVSHFNHWKPRGDTGYLDADFREQPNESWRGYADSVFEAFQEQGFIPAADELLRERVPYVLMWGGDEIPEDDPRWDDDDFEPPPVPATVYDCLFGDQ